MVNEPAKKQIVQDQRLPSVLFVEAGEFDGMRAQALSESATAMQIVGGFGDRRMAYPTSLWLCVASRPIIGPYSLHTI